MIRAAASHAKLHANVTALTAAVLELAHRNMSVPLIAVQHLAKQFLPATEAEALMKTVQDQGRWDSLFMLHARFCKEVLGDTSGAVITNGRVVSAAGVTAEDLDALAVAEHKLRALNTSQAIHSSIDQSWEQFSNANANLMQSRDDFESDQIVLASAVFFNIAKEKTDSAMRAAYMPPAFEKDTALLRDISVQTGTPNASLSMVVALNPLTKEAQQLAPVMLLLLEHFDVSIKLILYPPSSLSELPLKNYYRYVLPPKEKWTADGTRVYQPRGVFDRLPESQMLTT